jgi:hypothetical protein
VAKLGCALAFLLLLALVAAKSIGAQSAPAPAAVVIAYTSLSPQYAPVWIA